MESPMAVLAVGIGLVVASAFVIGRPTEANRAISRFLSGGRFEMVGRAQETRLIAIVPGAIGLIAVALALWRLAGILFP